MSRRWVALSQAQLHEWLSSSIKELDLPVVMIDGIHFRDRVILVALDVDAKGTKHVLRLREGSAESPGSCARCSATWSSASSMPIVRGYGSSTVARPCARRSSNTRRPSCLTRSTAARVGASLCPSAGLESVRVDARLHQRLGSSTVRTCTWPATTVISFWPVKVAQVEPLEFDVPHRLGHW